MKDNYKKIKMYYAVTPDVKVTGKGKGKRKLIRDRFRQEKSRLRRTLGRRLTREELQELLLEVIELYQGRR